MHALLPQEKKSEISTSGTVERDAVFFRLLAEEDFEGTENPELYAEISKCLATAFRANGILEDFHVATRMPIGLVAQQWRRGTVSLDIRQGGDELPNLVFGPASGLRTPLISQWCKENKRCVICTPNSGAADLSDAKTVSIALREDAKFVKVTIGTAPLSGHRKHPYQLVEPGDGLSEGIGRRIGFECSN